MKKNRFFATILFTVSSILSSPANYNQYTGSVQHTEALNLMNHLPFVGTEKVLDYGCRSGKLTLWLAQHVPQGKILAVDHDQEMLSFAKKQLKDAGFENALFTILNETSLSIYKNAFDYIASTAYLHWVGNYEHHFNVMHKLLKPGGKIVVRLGISDELGRKVPLHCHVDAIAQRTRWNTSFAPLQPQWYYPLELESARILLESIGFTLLNIAYVYRTATFASTDDLAHWILTWLPHAYYLSQTQAYSFACEVAERFDALCAHDDQGNILLERPCLEIIAQK